MHLVTAFCSICISVPLVLLLDPCHFGWLCLYCWWDVVSVHCINIRWSKSIKYVLFTHTMVTFGHQNTPMLSLCKVSYTIWANTWLDMLPYVHPVIAGQLQHLLTQLCAIDECLLKRCMQCVVLILHGQGTWFDAYSLMGSKLVYAYIAMTYSMSCSSSPLCCQETNIRQGWDISCTEHAILHWPYYHTYVHSISLWCRE